MPATVAATFENYRNIALATAYRYRRNVAFEDREDLEQSAALAALEALQSKAKEPTYSVINRVLYRETVNRGWQCFDSEWQRPETYYESWTEFADEATNDFELNELEHLDYQIFANVYQKLADRFGNWVKAAASKARFLVRQAERTADYQRWLTLWQAANVCQLYALFGSQGLAGAWLLYQQQPTTKVVTKDANEMLLDYPEFRAFYRKVGVESRYDRANAKANAQLFMREALDQKEQTGKTETSTILAMTMFRLYYKYGSQVEAAWAELAEIGFAVGDELHPVKPKSANCDKTKVKETSVVAA